MHFRDDCINNNHEKAQLLLMHFRDDCINNNQEKAQSLLMHFRDDCINNNHEKAQLLLMHFRDDCINNNQEKARSLLMLGYRDNNVGWWDVMYNPYEKCFSMPKIKLETYEFYLKLFGTPDFDIVREILSDEVLIKYFKMGS
jgi:hypothetical protein